MNTCSSCSFRGCPIHYTAILLFYSVSFWSWNSLVMNHQIQKCLSSLCHSSELITSCHILCTSGNTAGNATGLLRSSVNLIVFWSFSQNWQIALKKKIKEWLKWKWCSPWINELTIFHGSRLNIFFNVEVRSDGGATGKVTGLLSR